MRPPLRAPTMLPCLVCGVDSGPALRLFLLFVGLGVLGTFCVLAWGHLTGKFMSSERSAQLPLWAESEDE